MGLAGSTLARCARIRGRDSAGSLRSHGSARRDLAYRARAQPLRGGSLAADLDRTLYDLADGLRAVAVALAAYLPETASRILTALGQSADLGWDRVRYGLTEPVGDVVPAAPLFPRVDQPVDAV